MEHISNGIEGHSGFANNDCFEVTNKVHIYCSYLIFAESFEQVSGIVEGGEDIIRLEGEVLLKGGQDPKSQKLEFT